MTKGELIKALEPFTDDIEVCVDLYDSEAENHAPAAIRLSTYCVLGSGEGILLLEPGKFLRRGHIYRRTQR